MDSSHILRIRNSQLLICFGFFLVVVLNASDFANPQNLNRRRASLEFPDFRSEVI